MATFSGLIQETLPKWIIYVLIPWLSESNAVPNWFLVMTPLFIIVITVAVIIAITPEFPRISTWLDPKDLRTLKYATGYLHYKRFLDLLTSIDCDLRQSLERQRRGDKSSLTELVDSVFIQTFEFFGPQVRTGVIFRPKEDEPEWLRAWRASPGHYLSEKTFYIGQDRQRFKDRGCAGQAFVEDRPIKYNIIDPQTGEADQPCKKVFEAFERKRLGPDYLSSVSVPIHWSTKVVGVLCIDSKQRDFFTDEDIGMIQVIADKIGDALYLHKDLG